MAKKEEPKAPCEAVLTIEAFDNAVAKVHCTQRYRHPGPHQGTVRDLAWEWVRIEWGDFSE
jgi:hypothetical protein